MEFGGKYGEAVYSRGATEYQEEEPFENESWNVLFSDVEPYEKTVIAYRLVTDG